MSAINPNDPNYVVDANVGPVATGVEVERSWLSRYWWLLLLALLALAALLWALRGCDRNNCATVPTAANLSIPATDTVWTNLEGAIPEVSENQAAVETALKNVCIAHLGGTSGSALETKITNEFATAIPGLDIASHLSNISGWVTGATGWCHC